jgi:Fe-S-cluster containining protein
MKCLECHGACCEDLGLEINPQTIPTHVLEWIKHHASRIEDQLLIFEVRCTKLTSDGLCSIYEDRPLICATFPPGSEACLNTVKRRRTIEDYQRIRDQEDPEVIHG